MIVVKNLAKKFGDKYVLKDVSFEISKGTSFVLIGKSGSGKSVLLKNLMGIMKPNSGDIFINGVNTTNIPQYKRILMNRNLGMLFQFSALFDSMNVGDNIVFPVAVHHKLSKKDADILAQENLEVVGLDRSVLNLYPSELSGGMQKRVAIARLLSTKPTMVFFDEPTSGLDPVMSEMINDLIKKVVQHLGATSFTITHDMKSAKSIANKIAMIHNGEIVWSGLPSDVDASNNTTVNNFINGIYQDNK